MLHTMYNYHWTKLTFFKLCTQSTQIEHDIRVRIYTQNKTKTCPTSYWKNVIEYLSLVIYYIIYFHTNSVSCLFLDHLIKKKKQNDVPSSVASYRGNMINDAFFFSQRWHKCYKFRWVTTWKMFRIYVFLFLAR